MTGPVKPVAGAAAAIEPIIELVEVISLRWIVLAAVAGFVVSFAILYAMSDRIRTAGGMDDGSGS